jgi:cysteinyl-tRNA synthetase
MHNGMLRFTGEKMSKSVGNVATIQEVIAEWGREAALLFFLTGHWRKPIDFSEETMTAARAQVEGLRNALRERRSTGDWSACCCARRRFIPGGSRRSASGPG